MLQIYKASAGSGKTYTLVREYLLHLLDSNTAGQDRTMPHEHILAVTFTKKATAEMKSRILDELYNLAHGKQCKYKDFLLDKLHIDDSELSRRSRQAIVGILLRYSRFSVNTIDSFFQQIVRQFSHELGLPGAYAIDLDEKHIQEQAIDDMLFNLSPKDESGNPNPLLGWIEQWALNNIDDGEAWDPKNRISKLAEQIAKEKIQGTLKDTSAKLHDKVFLVSYYKQLYSIINSYTSELSRIRNRAMSVITDFGLTPKDFRAHSFTAFTSNDIPDTLGVIFCSCVEDGQKCYTKTSSRKTDIDAAYNNGLGDCYRQMHSLIYGSKGTDYRTASEIIRHLYAIGLLGDVMQQIDNTNETLGRLPMSDVGYWLERITEQTDTPFVYEKLGQRLKYYMIDEFQDTSRRQWHNFRPLVKERIDSGGDSLIVGDVKQSIYRWRNSDWHLLAGELENDIPQHKQDTLDDNYRSSKEVVHFNNNIMWRLSHRLQNLFNSFNSDTSYSRTITDAYADVCQKVKSKPEGYVAVRMLESDKFREKALGFLLSYLQQAFDNGAQPSDIAILTRSNKEITLISDFLNGKTYIFNGQELPYKIATQEGLLVCAHPVVMFIIDTLRLTLTPDDRTLLLQRHYNYLIGGSKMSASEAMEQACSTTPEYETTDKQILKSTATDLLDFLQLVIRGYGLSHWQNATTYITCLTDMAYQFMQNETSQVAAFLEWWDTTGCNRSIAAPDRSDAIRLMTIHKSKGLEFPVVIVPFCDWKVVDMKADMLWTSTDVAPFNELPVVGITLSKRLALTHFKNTYIEETINKIVDSLNMLYVALTRAKQMLVVICKQPNEKEESYSDIGSHVAALLNSADDGGMICEERTILPPAVDGLFEYGNNRLAIRNDVIASQTELPSGKSYPIGDRLKQKSATLDYLTSSGQLTTLNLGTLMHEILSMIKTQADLPSAHDELEETGRINRQQRKELEAEAGRFFGLVSKTDWFENVWDKILCERDILTPGTSIYRPDRIMIRGKQAVIIDYKFGNKRLPSYQKQVSNYMQLLASMGYEVTGYLVYAALETIEQCP